MRKILNILIFCLPIFCYGTRQKPDSVIYQGDTFSMRYFGHGSPSPFNDFFNDTTKKYPFENLGTACWRGYIAKWKINNDSLFLIEISRPDTIIYLDYFHKTKCKNNKVFADWHSGFIFCESTKEEISKKTPCDTSSYNAERPSIYYIFEIANGVIKRKEKFDLYVLDCIESKCYIDIDKDKIEIYESYISWRRKLLEERKVLRTKIK